VAPVRESDRARRVRVPDAGSQLAVRHGLAVGNLEQSGPHPLLERRPFEPQTDVEGDGLAGEVGVELLDDVLEAARVVVRFHTARGRVGLLVHPEPGERVVVAGEGERPDRAVDDAASRAVGRHVASGGQWLMGWSCVDQRYWTAYARHGRHVA